MKLGTRAGVPNVGSAGVDLAAALRDTYPELAEQVSDPAALLLPKGEPIVFKKRASLLDRTYPILVRKMVKNKMQKVLPKHKLYTRSGKVVLSTCFAVPKNADEDRMISNPMANDLVDLSKLKAPVFAYVPRMCVMKTSKGSRLYVSKRDARHYFHKLQLGRKWVPIFAHGL